MAAIHPVEWARYVERSGGDEAAALEYLRQPRDREAWAGMGVGQDAIDGEERLRLKRAMQRATLALLRSGALTFVAADLQGEHPIPRSLWTGPDDGFAFHFDTSTIEI